MYRKGKSVDLNIFHYALSHSNVSSYLSLTVTSIMTHHYNFCFMDAGESGLFSLQCTDTCTCRTPAFYFILYSVTVFHINFHSDLYRALLLLQPKHHICLFKASSLQWKRFGKLFFFLLRHYYSSVGSQTFSPSLGLEVQAPLLQHRHLFFCFTWRLKCFLIQRTGSGAVCR